MSESRERWTDEEAEAAFNEANKHQPCPTDLLTKLNVGRAILDRGLLAEMRGERATKAEAERARVAALVAVLTNRTEVLKAECRAWRMCVRAGALVPRAGWLETQEREALGHARAATDAALGGEGL